MTKSPQRPLNPTLWRTGRALAGRTRIRLFRELVANPGSSVSELADAVHIGQSDASQELRRLQSRGLLQRRRAGPKVVYRPVPDPQVYSAEPLLEALFRCMAKPASADEDILRIAQGAAHDHRIRLIRHLLPHPLRTEDLRNRTQLPVSTLKRHLNMLEECRWVRRQGALWEIRSSSHPLAQTLLRLIR
jgi:DNA-binding MarR family transcriptional regulator